jgi:hypothetical protein
VTHSEHEEVYYVLSESNYHRQPREPANRFIDKPKQTWAEYVQSWTNMRKWTDYRESMAPGPAQEHVPGAYKDTQEYMPEPAYKESQEPEIACLVSAYNSSNDNNDATDSLLDSPSDLIYGTTGLMKVT